MPEKKKQEPAWLTAAVDQRLALMKEHMSTDMVGPRTVVFTPLSEPNPFANKETWERWERTCDRCSTYCPGEFYTGVVTREEFGTQVMFSYGVCPTCAKEFVDG